ncbi:MAG: hypothetical protein KBD64_01985 [Gammaproteobacteria bacterium]|nr:hypothetical protein [Gammaproteobacteria bacterium]
MSCMSWEVIGSLIKHFSDSSDLRDSEIKFINRGRHQILSEILIMQYSKKRFCIKLSAPNTEAYKTFFRRARGEARDSRFLEPNEDESKDCSLCISSEQPEVLGVILETIKRLHPRVADRLDQVYEAFSLDDTINYTMPRWIITVESTEILFRCTSPEPLITEINILKCDNEYYVKILLSHEDACRAFSAVVNAFGESCAIGKYIQVQTKQKNVLGIIFQIVQSIQSDFSEISTIISSKLSLDLSDKFTMPAWVITGSIVNPLPIYGYYDYIQASIMFQSTHSDNPIKSVLLSKKRTDGEYTLLINGIKTSKDLRQIIIALRALLGIKNSFFDEIKDRICQELSISTFDLSAYVRETTTKLYSTYEQEDFDYSYQAQAKLRG